MSMSGDDVQAMVEAFQVHTQQVASLAQSLQVRPGATGHVILSVPGRLDQEVQANRMAVAQALEQLAQFPSTSLASLPNAGHVRHKTKQRFQTIGVYAKCSMWEKMASLASARGQSPSQVHRALMYAGVTLLDKRLDKESSSRVFAEIGLELESFAGKEKKQRMVRIDETFYNRAIFVAKEQGKSLSVLAALCMAHALRQAQE